MAESLDKLIANVKPKAKVPKGFGLWSKPMMIAWLRQNQRKPSKAEREAAK